MKLKEETTGLQTVVNGLVTENLQLKEKIRKFEKAMGWMLSEIRRFQEETLKRLGETPEEIERAMREIGSKREDYIGEET